MKVTFTVTGGPHAGRTFEFDRHETFIVGRGSQAHFRLPRKDEYFSRVHFMVEVNPPHCRLMDMGSTNGTYVRNRRVKTIDLRNGDLIQGGDTVIRVAIQAPEVAAADRTIVPSPQPLSQRERGFDADRSVDFDPREPAEADVEPTLKPPARPARTSPPEPHPSIPSEQTVPPSPRNPPAATTPSPPVAAGTPTPSPPPRSVLPPDYQERTRRHPQPIAGYKLVDEIGRGGMGIVYLAVREADGSVVALKTIKPATVAEPADVERFLREASILRELDHPNIVAFRDVGRSDELLYFAMDYVAGTDASKLVRDHDGPLPIGRAVRLVCQLLDALEYAHARGFIHRDIKPANILLETGGVVSGGVVSGGVVSGAEAAVSHPSPLTPHPSPKVKLTDFGLARTYQTSRLSGLTLMGDVGGTIPYMAPEQITHYRDSKPPVDQYAAAATLYHLLTRKYIHDFPRDVSRRLILILQHDPVPIRTRRPDVPEPLAAVIHRGLERDPQNRFTQVGELRDALVPFRED